MSNLIGKYLEARAVYLLSGAGLAVIWWFIILVIIGCNFEWVGVIIYLIFSVIMFFVVCEVIAAYIRNNSKLFGQKR
jgi:hypothetical protein